MNFKFEIKARDIVLANPNYEDQKEGYERPLLVISKSLFHQNSGFFVCVGITTNQKPDPYLIPILSKDIEDAILKEKSQVMCKRIVTVREDAIIKRVCKVTPEFYNKIKKKIVGDILDF